MESLTLDVSPPLAELAASGNLPAIETNAATSKRALRSATQPNPETSRSLSSDPSQCNLPHAHSTSATISSASKTSVEAPVATKAAGYSTSKSTLATQSSRRAAADASHALLEKVISDLQSSYDSDPGLLGNLDDLQEYDEDKNSLEVESVHGSSDGGIDKIEIALSRQLSIPKATQKTAKPKKGIALVAAHSKVKGAVAVLGEDSDDDSAGQGEILKHQ